MLNLYDIKKILKHIRIYKKTISVLLIFILSTCIYKYFTISPPSNIQDEKNVEVEVVKSTTIKEMANFIGTIRSRQQTALKAKANGTLKIIAKPGELVKKGDLIAQIDNEDIERNYKILSEAQEIAKTQFDRANSLLKSGASSKSAVEEKKAHHLAMQAKQSQAKISLEEIKIIAPFDGVVGLFKLREGSQVNKEDIIVQLYDPHSLIVEFDVPLSVATNVQDGGQIIVNEKIYHLTHIQKMLDEETHMCPAYAEIECPTCVVGTTVDVSVVTKEKEAVLVIPFESIFLQEGKPFVYILKDNKAVLTPITLGIRDKTHIEITSGLKAGDQLIPFGHDRLYPDVAVKISVPDSPPPVSDAK